jgi:hypothetical protein
MCYTFLFLHLSNSVRNLCIIVCISFFAVFISCKKDDTIIGLDVQPENDLLYGSYDESTKIISQTVFDTALLSSLNNLGVYLLGSYQDPIFGRSDADIYTNFILKDNITAVNTGSKPQMDSVVLSLAYKIDFYGDSTDALKVNVHMLQSSVTLNKDSLYYSNEAVAYEAADITESGNGYVFNPHPASYVNVGGTYLKPQVRIRLDKTWFEDNLLLMDNINLASTAAMQQVFKGLYITTNSTSTFSPDYGSILFFSLYDANTSLTFYYHNFTEPTQKIQLTCGGGTAHFNHYEHDYGTANSSLQGQIDNSTATNDTLLGQQNVFIQCMAGLGMKLQMPELSKYCDSGAIAVAKAELIFPVDQDAQWYSDKYKVPLAFGIKAYTSTGTLVNVADAGASWMGGSYDATNKVFRINIPRHISNICNGKTGNYGFLVYPSETTSKPYRAVITGSKHSTPIKLQLSYTKLYKK